MEFFYPSPFICIGVTDGLFLSPFLRASFLQTLHTSNWTISYTYDLQRCVSAFIVR